MFRHLLIVVALSFGCLVGCSKKTATYDTPEGQRVTMDQGSKQTTMTITDDKGGQSTLATGSSVSLPKDFSSDIPIYSGATPMASMDTPNGKQVTLKVATDMATVVEFYKKQLSDNGWKVKGMVASPVGSVITASKDSRQLTVSIGGSGKEAAITLILTKK